MFLGREWCLRNVIYVLVFISFRKTGNFLKLFYSKSYKTESKDIRENMRNGFLSRDLNFISAKFHRLK